MLNFGRKYGLLFAMLVRQHWSPYSRRLFIAISAYSVLVNMVNPQVQTRCCVRTSKWILTFSASVCNIWQWWWSELACHIILVPWSCRPFAGWIIYQWLTTVLKPIVLHKHNLQWDIHLLKHLQCSCHWFSHFTTKIDVFLLFTMVHFHVQNLWHAVLSEIGCAC
jgi:hypothetical protein